MQKYYAALAQEVDLKSISTRQIAIAILCSDSEQNKVVTTTTTVSGKISVCQYSQISECPWNWPNSRKGNYGVLHKEKAFREKLIANEHRIIWKLLDRVKFNCQAPMVNFQVMSLYLTSGLWSLKDTTA